ncbi:MAG: four helix bundle protein [Thermodesulfobacteriota bacterium]
MHNKKELKDRTKNFALRIIKMYSSLPKSIEAQVMGKQVLRSGTSVGANYREASQIKNTKRNLKKK